MPVIAVSPPLVFGEGVTPRPPITPTPPVIRPTPAPFTPIPSPITPTGICDYETLLSNHQKFISRVDNMGACFRRNEMPQFNDQEFQFHAKIAELDKYLVLNEDMYCSMQAVQNLATTLKRFTEI